jgi:hypothetical protein
MRQLNRITGIEGVTQGGNATVSLPTGRRYHGVKFYARVNGVLAPIETVIGKVRAIVNGVTVRDLTALQILGIAQANGLDPSEGELPIFFSEPWRASVMGEEATSWDMAGQNSFKYELQILEQDEPTDVVQISGVMEFDYIRNRNQEGKPMLAIIRQSVTTYNVPAGQYDMDTLPVRFPIQRIWLDGPEAISAVEVTRDSEKVYEVTNAQNQNELADYKIDGTTFAFPIVFDFTQQITDGLEVARTLNLRVTSEEPQAIGAIVEAVAPGFL